MAYIHIYIYIPAWGPLLNIELVHKIDGFLKRSYRYGFTSKLITMKPFINSTTKDLFCKMQRSSHCLYPLLPPPDRERSYSLRDRGHCSSCPHVIITYTRNLLCKLCSFLTVCRKCWNTSARRSTSVSR